MGTGFLLALERGRRKGGEEGGKGAWREDRKEGGKGREGEGTEKTAFRSSCCFSILVTAVIVIFTRMLRFPLALGGPSCTCVTKAPEDGRSLIAFWRGLHLGHRPSISGHLLSDPLESLTITEPQFPHLEGNNRSNSLAGQLGA